MVDVVVQPWQVCWVTVNAISVFGQGIAHQGIGLNDARTLNHQSVGYQVFSRRGITVNRFARCFPARQASGSVGLHKLHCSNPKKFLGGACFVVVKDSAVIFGVKHKVHGIVLRCSECANLVFKFCFQG